MNKTLAVALAIVSGVVVSALIFGAGLFIGRSNIGVAGNNPYTMMGQGYTGQGFKMMGNGNNMMGGFRFSGTTNARPLTVDQAKKAVEGYLKGLNNTDLDLKEIMVFDNNAYARITEKSTGIGAMELLVDPASLEVIPEYGPNMMWNLKYGHMSGAGSMIGNYNGMMGGRGMMGGYQGNPPSANTQMPVTPDQALRITQQYLDQQLPGSQAATDADPFFGYYTIDILKNGKPTGMLSVNGFSGQVFLHTWHGTFLAISE